MKQFKRSAIYYSARGFIAVINSLPRRLALFLGEWLGMALYVSLGRERHRIHRHLNLVFKNSLTNHQKRNIARSFFVNTGKNLVDVVRFKKHFRSEIKPSVEIVGLEHFERAYRAGKGLVGVTGHIGNFELLAAYIADLGYKIAVIGREMYDRRFDRLLVENRAAVGLTNISTTDSPKRLIGWLKDGGAVGVLIDTDSFRVRSMFIPFFGRLSNTPVGQTAIGLRVGAAFLPTACVRIAGDRYRIIIRPQVEYAKTGDDEKDIYAITRLCTRALEEIIRQYPDQWIWLHNCWHTRPEESS